MSTTGKGKFKTDMTERAIYSEICSHDGIKAREIARNIAAKFHLDADVSKKMVNQYLYQSALMHELCYHDDDFLWHGLIRQTRPHYGLPDFCGYYGTVGEFTALSEDAWFDELLEGCRNIGRNLNDTRGLFHSFRDCRQTMLQLFEDLQFQNALDPEWEIVFELRINRARYIRIYSDVLVITKDKVFSLEFKMKDKIDPEEVMQAGKYAEYLEILFGPRYDVISALVLTRAEDLYQYEFVGNTDNEIPVCSGDMLFNLFDEYMHFLKE